MISSHVVSSGFSAAAAKPAVATPLSAIPEARVEPATAIAPASKAIASGSSSLLAISCP